MISDEKLAAAAEELFDAMLNSLPDEKECDHRFSPQFEKKMKRLIRRTEHPACYRVLRSVAGLALAIIVGFAALLAASPTVRASFFGWVKEQYDVFTRYYFVGSSSQNPEWNSYELSYIPEGYVEWRRTEKENVKIVMYENPQTMETLQFICSRDYNSLSLYVLSQDCTTESVVFNSKNADLILPNNPADTASILWYEPVSNSFCIISAHLKREELILIAEGVK